MELYKVRRIPDTAAKISPDHREARAFWRSRKDATEECNDTVLGVLENKFQTES